MEQRVQIACLVILSAVASGAALYWLRPIMIPFVLAIFIALGLSMLIDFQTTRLRFPRALALLGTLLLAFLFFGAVAAVVSASVSQLAENATRYSEQLSLMLSRLAQTLPDGVRERLGSDFQSLSQVSADTIGRTLGRITSAIVDVLSKSFLVFVLVAFLLAGSGSGRPVTGTWNQIRIQVQGYLLSKAVISAVTGALVGATLAILGIPLAMMFGLLAFLLNFIPNVGSVVATLLPLPVVIVTPEVSTLAAVLALVIPAAIQLVIGNVVEPKVMGQSLDLHPVAILLSLIFWGMLWGIVGMFLATPITAVLKILCEKFDGSRPIAELLAGRITREPARS